jgi:hypothetical protein
MGNKEAEEVKMEKGRQQEENSPPPSQKPLWLPTGIL